MDRLLQVDLIMRQRIEPSGAEEWFGRFDQQDYPGKAIVIEAAAEVHERLDREHVEFLEIEA